MGYVLILGEGMVALNGLMAAEAPRLYGGVLTLMSPLAVTANLGTAGAIAGVAGTIAIGQYSFTYPSDSRIAKKRRFWVTVAGMHALPLLTYLADLLAGTRVDKGKGKTLDWRFSVRPYPEGGEFLVARRF